jgi:hypothetical protein
VDVGVVALEAEMAAALAELDKKGTPKLTKTLKPGHK